MTDKFTVNGRLPGLNEYTTACRTNPYSGSQMKRTAQTLVIWAAKARLRTKFKKPVIIHYKFYEKDRRRDKSNVASFAVKVIEDALVSLQVIHDDGWKYIEGYDQEFFIDKKRPRIEVEIEETE